MRSQIEEITRNLDRRLSIHDFRIVEGPTHTNLIFDVAVPSNANSPTWRSPISSKNASAIWTMATIVP